MKASEFLKKSLKEPVSFKKLKKPYVTMQTDHKNEQEYNMITANSFILSKCSPNSPDDKITYCILNESNFTSFSLSPDKSEKIYFDITNTEAINFFIQFLEEKGL